MTHALRLSSLVGLSYFTATIAISVAGGPVVYQGLYVTPNTTAGWMSRLAIDGTTLLVGYPDADDNGVDKGAVYVVERQSNGTWSKTGTIPPGTTAQPIFSFGERVALDFDTAAIGDPSSGQGGGGVWMFRRSGGTWTQEAEIHPLAPFPVSHAGVVDVSGDDVIIGAPLLYNGSKFCGGVFFYHRVGSTWLLGQGPIYPTDAATGGAFANEVAIDGNIAVSSFPPGGRAYILERTGPGSPWGEIEKLNPPNAAADEFGSSLAVAGDWIAIGAPFDDQKAQDAGAVRIYQRVGTGPNSWIEQSKLVAADGAIADHFGNSVALHGDRLVVGAYDDSLGAASSAGSAYVFERQPSGTWLQTAKLQHPAPHAADQTGWAVAVSQAGVIAVASPFDIAPDVASVLMWDAQTLSSTTSSISLSAGGAQVLDVQAGIVNAGKTYLVAGSVSGTSPGMAVPGGFNLPLNYDAYTAFTLFTPNNPVLSSSLGVLGTGGGNQATFALPPGVDPTLAGITVSHAFLVLNASSVVKLVSNPLALQLVP